ncbi:MAG TPA: hypothetical protein DCG08_07595 [Dialister sp.]|nr:hypothetical protein [Dialister sp.]
MAKRKNAADWMLARVREYLSGKVSDRQIIKANGISERSIACLLVKTIKTPRTMTFPTVQN